MNLRTTNLLKTPDFVIPTKHKKQTKNRNIVNRYT